MTKELVSALFDGSCTPGVYRVIAPSKDVLEGLRQAGWRAGYLPDAWDKEQFLAGLGEALEFPEHYGRNLDAAWDCLTDLGEPSALLWIGWSKLAIDHPDDWAAIVGLLTERSELDPPFAVVFG